MNKTTEPKKATQAVMHPARFFCLNPVTNRFEEIFPEDEIGEKEQVTPMFWGGRLGYVTVPGTEFYGSPWA